MIDEAISYNLTRDNIFGVLLYMFNTNPRHCSVETLREAQKSSKFHSQTC